MPASCHMPNAGPSAGSVIIPSPSAHRSAVPASPTSSAPTSAAGSRTGAWLAIDHWNAKPDLIIFAKGSNSGYVPLGGVIISDEIAATFDERVFPGGLTYSGHPLACASALATIEAMANDGIVEHARDIGETVIGPGLRELAERHDVIGEVRGLGVFWALDLVSDRATREPLAPYGGSSPAMAALTSACVARGLLPFVNFNRLHVVPPCIVTADEAKEGLLGFAVERVDPAEGEHSVMPGFKSSIKSASTPSANCPAARIVSISSFDFTIRNGPITSGTGFN